MRVHKLKEKFRLLVIFAAIATVQCSTTGFGPQGWLFTSTKIGVHATSNSGSKTGSACTFSILGILALGDGSINAAATDGGISKISAIDLKGLSILGIFSNQCTIVRGD